MIPFAVIKLFFGGLLKRAIGAATALFGIIGRYPWQAAVIALLALSAFMWRGKANAIDERDLARAETKAQAASYRAAQVQAKAAQAAQDRTEFGEKTQLAEQIHDLSKQSKTAARAAVAVYARDNPVRLCHKAAGSAGGGTGSAGLPRDPGQPVDGDPAAELVAITRADLDTLGDEAVQSAVKTLYLNALVDAGWGVPLSALPAPDMPVDRERP